MGAALDRREERAIGEDVADGDGRDRRGDEQRLHPLASAGPLGDHEAREQRDHRRCEAAEGERVRDEREAARCARDRLEGRLGAEQRRDAEERGIARVDRAGVAEGGGASKDRGRERDQGPARSRDRRERRERGDRGDRGDRREVSPSAPRHHQRSEGQTERSGTTERRPGQALLEEAGDGERLIAARHMRCPGHLDLERRSGGDQPRDPGEAGSERSEVLLHWRSERPRHHPASEQEGQREPRGTHPRPEQERALGHPALEELRRRPTQPDAHGEHQRRRKEERRRAPPFRRLGFVHGPEEDTTPSSPGGAHPAIVPSHVGEARDPRHHLLQSFL
jgi:hypothetical protein